MSLLFLQTNSNYLTIIFHLLWFQHCKGEKLNAVLGRPVCFFCTLSTNEAMLMMKMWTWKSFCFSLFILCVVQITSHLHLVHTFTLSHSALPDHLTRRSSTALFLRRLRSATSSPWIDSPTQRTDRSAASSLSSTVSSSASLTADSLFPLIRPLAQLTDQLSAWRPTQNTNNPDFNADRSSKLFGDDFESNLLMSLPMSDPFVPYGADMPNPLVDLIRQASRNSSAVLSVAPHPQKRKFRRDLDAPTYDLLQFGKLFCHAFASWHEFCAQKIDCTQSSPSFRLFLSVEFEVGKRFFISRDISLEFGETLSFRLRQQKNLVAFVFGLGRVFWNKITIEPVKAEAEVKVAALSITHCEPWMLARCVQTLAVASLEINWVANLF